MIKYIKPYKDSFIDELNPTFNFGLNNTLHLKKEKRDLTKNYNTRILIKFDEKQIQSIIDTENLKNPDFYLNLYSVESYNIDFINNIKIYPISQSWNNGTGISAGDNYLQAEDGVSWKFRKNIDESNTTWSFSNTTSNVTWSYQTNEGGGIWFTSVSSSQEFNYYDNDIRNLDIRTDVTNIINNWLSESIDNHGIIIKRTNEQEGDHKKYKEISYFSKDTSTIYPPVIEIIEDDSIFNTGSNEQIDLLNNSYRVYSQNVKHEYNQKEKYKINVFCNKKFQNEVTYQTELTSSLSNKLLTSQSYYEVVRTGNNEVAIPKSKGTKISVNNGENYFIFDFNNLPRHYNYKFRYVIEQDNIVEYYEDNKIFTVK